MKSFFKISMFIAVLCMALPDLTSGQVVTRHSKDSVVNAQTRLTTWSSTADGMKGIQLTAVKVSGTVSAYAVLETKIDTVASVWKIVVGSDTAFLTDQAAQGHIWPINNHYGNSYRTRIVSTGTQKFYVYLTLLKRSR